MGGAGEILPRRFGRFVLVERLAAGGMGEIYLAKLRGPGGFEKLLVIKRVLAEMSDRADFVEMFLAEARVAAKLSHRNIAQIFEMGRTEERYYLAMEHVAGRSLNELLRRLRFVGQRLPVGHALEIALQICDGLAYAHAASDGQGPLRVIHRDISPRNLLLSYNGEVKIIDFGIAKSRMSLQPTAAGVVKGKLGYMSPEQSAARRVDHRTDLFAAGVVFYELLTGVHPFLREDPVLTFDAIQRQPHEPLARIDPALAPLDPVVARALAKEPADRYPSGEAFQRDLQRLRGDGLVPAPASSLAEYVRELFADELAQDLALTQRAALASASAPSVTPRTPAPDPGTTHSGAAPIRPRAWLLLAATVLAAGPGSVQLYRLGAARGGAASRAPFTAAAGLATPTPPADAPRAPVPPAESVEPSAAGEADPSRPPVAPALRRTIGSLEIITSPEVRIGRAGRRGAARLSLTATTGQLWLGTGSDPERDPFRVRLGYRIDARGVAYTLDAEPFAVAQSQIGAGLGRTPLRLEASREPVVLTLIHPPDRRRLQLTLRYTVR